MLPREFIEELFSGFTATGLHVLVALADAFNGKLAQFIFHFFL